MLKLANHLAGSIVEFLLVVLHAHSLGLFFSTVSVFHQEMLTSALAYVHSRTVCELMVVLELVVHLALLVMVVSHLSQSHKVPLDCIGTLLWEGLERWVHLQKQAADESDVSNHHPLGAAG